MSKDISERYKYITQKIGITYPIIQGAMGNISDHILASAVSEAGGLGTIAGGGLTPDELRSEIKLTRMHTCKPFAVNVPLKSEYADEQINIVCEEGVPVLFTGAGNPEKYIDKVKNSGVLFIPVVGFVSLAKRLSRYGVDAVVAEGCESGGHIGDVTTMCLVPQIVDSVNIPVIAAGGIGDGRGVAAAYMLGASAVQLGTLFLMTKECRINPFYKEKIKNARDISTVVLNHSRTELDSIRALRNALTTKYLENESNGFEHINLEGALKKAAIDGDSDNGLFMCGQISGLLREELSVSDYIDKVWKQAREILEIQ